MGLSFKGQDNIWDLAFNDDVPLDLAVTVSDADIDLLLSGLSLTRLETVSNSGTITAENFQVDGNTYSYVTAESPAAKLDIQIAFERGQITLELAQ